MENDEPKLKLRGFRDSLVNDKLENNNMATAASSGTISKRPHAPWTLNISKTKWIRANDESGTQDVGFGFCKCKNEEKPCLTCLKSIF